MNAQKPCSDWKVTGFIHMEAYTPARAREAFGNGMAALALVALSHAAMDHRLAASKHARDAALHLGATDDRAGYWRLLAEAEMIQNRPAEAFLQLATRYSLGLVDGRAQPEACLPGV